MDYKAKILKHIEHDREQLETKIKILNLLPDGLIHVQNLLFEDCCRQIEIPHNPIAIKKLESWKAEVEK